MPQEEAISQTCKTYKAESKLSICRGKALRQVSYTSEQTNSKKKKKNAFIATKASIIPSIRRSDTSSRLAGSEGEEGSIDSFWSFSSSHTGGGCSPSNVCRPALSTWPRLVGAFSFSRRRPTPPSNPPAVTSFCPRHTGETAGTHSALFSPPKLLLSPGVKRGLTFGGGTILAILLQRFPTIFSRKNFQRDKIIAHIKINPNFNSGVFDRIILIFLSSFYFYALFVWSNIFFFLTTDSYHLCYENGWPVLLLI